VTRRRRPWLLAVAERGSVLAPLVAVARRGKGLTTIMSSTPTPTPTPQPQLPASEGWLEKLSKGGKVSRAKWQRRYFLLRGGVLSWGKDPAAAAAATDASISLRGARLELHGDKLVLTPSAEAAAGSAKVRGRYDLGAVSETDARRWAEHLERTMQQLDWRDSVERASAASSNVGLDGPSAALDDASGAEAPLRPGGAGAADAGLLFVRMYDGPEQPGSGEGGVPRTDLMRSALLDEHFALGMGAAGGGPAASWPDWAGWRVLPAIRCAEALMSELSTGLGAGELASRPEARAWFVAEYQRRFMRLLHCIAERVEGAVTAGSAMAAPGGSSRRLGGLTDDEALGVIGWCLRFRGRFLHIGVPTSDSGGGGDDADHGDDEASEPTHTRLYHTLVDAHMPSFRGVMRKPGSKMGHLGGCWISRYYVLKHGVLRYYKSPDAVAEHGAIPGELITSVGMAEGDEPCQLRLDWGGRQSVLRAPNAEDAGRASSAEISHTHLTSPPTWMMPRHVSW
jgi:hypothetical protein